MVGRKLAITSVTVDVLGRFAPSVRVMFKDVKGVPFAGEDSGPSRSMGVDAMSTVAIDLCLLLKMLMIRWSMLESIGE